MVNIITEARVSARHPVSRIYTLHYSDHKLKIKEPQIGRGARHWPARQQAHIMMAASSSSPSCAQLRPT